MFDCDDTLYDLSWPFRKCMEEFLPNVDVDMDLFYADYRKFGDMIFDDLQQGKITIDESGVYRIEKACEKYDIEFSYKYIRKAVLPNGITNITKNPSKDHQFKKI